MSKWYGSLQNRISENATLGQPEPVIGMGATLLHYSDRTPATVIGWCPRVGLLKLRSDNYKRIDDNGMSESQEYEYSSNPKGATHEYRRNKKTGRWDAVRFNAETNRYNKFDGPGLRLGEREKYHDFSF